MEKMSEKITKFALDNKYFIVGGIFIVVILLILYTFRSSISSIEGLTNSDSSNSNGTNSSSNSPIELMIFSADWCPHCKAAAPEWEKIEEEYSSKTINGRSVIFTKVNCTEETPDIEKLIKQYDVSGFPTVKLLKDGSVIDFDAKPTYDNFKSFLDTSTQ